MGQGGVWGLIDARVTAELSKLKLSEEELRRLQDDLNDIYSLIEKLARIEIDEEPMYTPSDLKNVARVDKPSESFGEDWMKIVPLKEETREGKYVISPKPL